MNNDNLIILIEDEPSHALLYKYKLLTEGYRVADFRGTDPIIEEMVKAKSSINLIVLSMELDQQQSTALYHQIQVLFPSIPVLLTTTAPELSNDTGEERHHYLTKPFELDVFLSKVRLLLLNASPSGADYFTQS